MKPIRILSLLVILFAVFASIAFAQSPNTLRNKCPNISTYSIVQITGVGDINVQPCPGKTTTFTQNVVLPSGTVINGGNVILANGSVGTPSLRFTNSLTTGLYRAAADTVGVSTAGVLNTSLSQAGNAYNSDTHVFKNKAAAGEFIFTLTPGAAGAGSAVLGDITGAAQNFIRVDNSAPSAQVQSTSVQIGDSSGTANGTNLSIADLTGTYDFQKTTATAVFDLDKVLNYQMFRTVTAGGTTGAQTISRPAGTLNVAAGQSSIVLTNTTVNTSSIPFVVLRTADTTCTFVKSAVPTANTLTITLNAACNAETSVGFIITN